MKTKLILMAGLLAFGASLQASTSFVYDGSSQSLTPSLGNSYAETVGGITATATAWWATVNNSGATVTGTTSDFAKAGLGIYASAGMGVCNPSEPGYPNCGNPQHQIDNYNGLDFAMFTFGTSSVSLGDVQVASFGNPTGSGSDNVDMSYAILSSSQLASLEAGTLVFSTVSFTTQTKAVGTSSADYTLSGSITSGEALLIGTAVTANYGGDSTPDAFKIQDLTVTAQSGGGSATPEPASFFLIGSGLLVGAVFGRRRLQKA